MTEVIKVIIGIVITLACISACVFADSRFSRTSNDNCIEYGKAGYDMRQFSCYSVENGVKVLDPIRNPTE